MCTTPCAFGCDLVYSGITIFRTFFDFFFGRSVDVPFAGLTNDLPVTTLGCHGTEYKNPSCLKIHKEIGNKKKSEKCKIPIPGWAPRKFEKKTEKSRKWSFSGHFRNCSGFSSYFWGPTRDGGFSIYSDFFFVLPGSRGFCILYHPEGDRNT